MRRWYVEVLIGVSIVCAPILLERILDVFFPKPEEKKEETDPEKDLTE